MGRMGAIAQAHERFGENSNDEDHGTEQLQKEAFGALKEESKG